MYSVAELRSPERIRERMLAPFRAVLLEWLAVLPGGRWSGTVAELELELLRVQMAHGLRAFIPRGSALGARVREEMGTFRDLGFDVTFHRTNAERTIKITPRQG